MDARLALKIMVALKVRVYLLHQFKANYVIGYHWFPASYISAASATYFSASPVATAFYSFISQWVETATAAANVPTSTASDELGTATAASLYYTPSTSSTNKSSKSVPSIKLRLNQRSGLLMALLLAAGLVI